MTWAPDYTTSAVAKAWLRIGDSVDDTQVASVITGSSRAIDRACGRQFGQVAALESRTYPSTWWRHEDAYRAVIDDVQDTTGLVVTDPGGSAVSSEDYTLGPPNAAALGRPYEWIDLPGAGTYTMQALWGWSAVPDTIPLAVHLQLARLLARRDSPFGVAGSPDTGTELRLLAKLDPDVLVTVRPYRRAWWAA